MHWLLRRHRKILASTVVWCWAFAVFVGVANACGWDGTSQVLPQLITQAHATGHALGDDVTPGHEHACGNDLPLLGVLGQVQDHPAGQPLVLEAYRHRGLAPIAAPTLRLARTAHPPPGVPLSLRTVRLAL